MPDSAPRLALEIVNDSSFPITVDEIGLRVRGTVNRFAVTVPEVVDGQPWPRRLEPRASVTAYARIDEEVLSLLPNVRDAYASTAAGETFYGHSPALRVLARTGAIPPLKRGLSRDGLPAYITVLDFDEP
ncbi:MAG: hypothetical protein AB7G10_24770 [Reyranellaceae bacterium]